MTAPTTLVIGHSDGIGQELVRQLLAGGNRVVAVSRRPSGLTGDSFTEVVQDVAAAEWPTVLERLATEHRIEVAVHCAAIGTGVERDSPDLQPQEQVLETNLLSVARTLSVLSRYWLATGTSGHFVGLSSLADVLMVPESPGYVASKAGVSSFLRASAAMLRPRGIYVTNVRFGFVDTKLAHAPIKPFQLTRERAARRLLGCLRRRPVQYSTPWFVAGLVRTVAGLQWLIRMAQRARRSARNDRWPTA